MIYDLQKASMWKRISALLLDVILLSILAVGFAALFSSLFHFDTYNSQLTAAYERYEEEFGYDFDITQDEYDAMSEEERSGYDAAVTAANEALAADEEAVYAYGMLLNLTLLILTLSILLSYAVLEFALPLIFGNGQTVGKKIFGIGLMRTDGVKITTFMLFVRTFLGKFTIETMIPVLILVMLYFGVSGIGFIGLVIIGLILLLQVVFLITTHTNSAIHDMLACTVAVDLSSQMIFGSPEELIAYKQRVQAEKAAKQDY
ncbi:MAG: RDD family protein [Firmicutes bacterium]|nr:RDD family protein [Bacillota bacterium]